MTELIIGIGIPAGLVILALLVVGFIFARLYRRSTREIALVKTGIGGRKVIIDGGTLVVPVLHEITKINMKTTRLEVKRAGQSALITLDRLRTDVGAEFYVAVDPTEEGIARAAQTLGARTFDESALREMIEGKLVDGLRGVAAKMTLDQLHENRSEFVQQVQQAVGEDLKKNGLALESVSLTALDQTPLEGLDENNIFNAVGMQHQAERIAESRKKRAQIEAEAQVAVARSQQEAEVRTYEIQRTQEAARVEQSVQMQALKAQEAAETARRKEQADREAAEARIAREKAIQIAEQERQREVEIAEQNRRIAIAQKSEEESQARAKADEASAQAVAANESITTAREVAEAERRRRITLIAAEEEAQKAATAIRVAAEAEKAAAADRAAALLETARAEAEQITIRAEAHKSEQLAQAEGLRALNDAENSIGANVIDFRKFKERLTAMPAIIEAMVKPAERIGAITINKIEGLNGPGSQAGTTGGTGTTSSIPNPVEQVFDQIRHNAVAMPVLNAIGAAVGLNVQDGLAGMIPTEEAPVALAVPPTPAATIAAE